MAGTPSDVPLQLLAVPAPALPLTVPTAIFAISSLGKPVVYLFQNQDGGYATHDHVATSELVGLPLQIAMWAAYFTPPGANPVILSWDIKLIVCKFPTNQQFIYSKTVWGRFPQTALQNPTFHFLVSNLGIGTRAIFSGGTLDVGDVFSVWIKSKIADVNNTYQGARWASASLFYYFTDTNLLIP